jgi:diguanylate cyclase
MAATWFAAFVVWQLGNWGGNRQELVVSDVAPIAVELALVVLALAARRRTVQPRVAIAWTWIAAAFASYLAGDITWAWYEVVLDRSPFPSPADAFYLAFYPLLLVGLLSFPTPRRTAGERLRLAMDVSIVVLSSMMIVWYFALGPTVHEVGGFTFANALAVAYPAGDLALIFGLAAVLLRGSDYAISTPLRILAAGLVSFVVADIGFAALDVSDSYTSGSWPDTFWMMALLLMALSADAQRHAGETSAARVNVAEASAHSRISTLPYLGIGASYALLLFVASSDARFPIDGLILGAASVTGVVVLRQVMALRDNVRLMDEFHRLATTDTLTGLPNRRHVLDLAETHLVRSRRERRPLSVIMMDVDNFKAINDTYGHAVGDQALAWIGGVCTGMLPPDAIVGRFGGDELLAILPGRDLAEALRLARSLAESAARAEQPLAGGPGHMTLSLGVASADNRPDVKAVLAAADAALYAAKRNGRNQARAESAN